jgi:hypothetical protein
MFANSAMARLVRATRRGTVLVRVARTSRAMTVMADHAEALI